MGVSLRAVQAADQAVIRQWAKAVVNGMSRTQPLVEAADQHDPAAGLFWYMIAVDERDVGTVWIELPPQGSEGVLGIFLGDATDRGHGVGTAAVEFAVAEFRRAHLQLPVALRVRCSNARAVSCYRRVGFAVTGHGSKTLPSGEVVPYYRMVLPAC
jgi:ribosomal protein S18 acetylase RimI-like enzyme